MKRLSYFLIFILLFLVFSVADVTETAFADSEIENELNGEVEENLNSLIDGNLENYFNELEVDFNGMGLKDWILSVIRGEQNFSFDKIGESFLNSFKSSLKTTIFSLLSILVLSLLSGFSSSLTAGFKKESTKQIIHFAVYGSIICTLAIMVGDTVKSVISTLGTLKEFTDVVFPIFLTLFTALGGSVGTSFIEPIILIFSNVVLKIILNLIIPIFTATVIFTFVGNLTDTVKLEKLTKTFKSIANWTLGIIFSILTTFISIQGVVGASIDSITLKSAKFALSSYVPILGGYLSEGFDIVLASCILIKNALGLSVFFIILTIILAPIIKILCLSLSLKLISSFVEPIGESKLSSLLFDTANNLNLLIASLAGVAFLLFIVTIIVIGAFNGGVV